MKSLYLTLAMDLEGPEGAGWYAYAAAKEDDGNHRTVLPGVRIAPQGAQIVAQGFERVMAGSGPPDITPLKLVTSGNQIMRSAIHAQLQAAEEAARRVKSLRQSLQALEEVSVTVEVPQERTGVESV